MSSLAHCRCRRCQQEFDLRWGGGFRYADRFCASCGAWRCLQYAEDPRTFEAFQALILAFQEPAAPLQERQRRLAQATGALREQVQAVLGPCPCGGAFSEERPRCPACAADDLEPLGQILLDYD